MLLLVSLNRRVQEKAKTCIHVIVRAHAQHPWVRRYKGNSTIGKRVRGKSRCVVRVVCMVGISVILLVQLVYAQGLV